MTGDKFDDGHFYAWFVTKVDKRGWLDYRASKS